MPLLLFQQLLAGARGPERQRCPPLISLGRSPQQLEVHVKHADFERSLRLVLPERLLRDLRETNLCAVPKLEGNAAHGPHVQAWTPGLVPQQHVG